MTTDPSFNPPPGKLGDPLVPDWAEMQLAETWADGIRFNTISGLSTFLRSIFGAPRQVEINADQALFSSIPKYALQEFHSLPNGNYSNKIARGYITGFDISMLGLVQKMRREIATRVSHCHSVLDVGTCGGKLAAAIKAAGATEVWGADISPYLLKHAATDHPDIRFIQAPAEDLPFADQRFDAIAVCFLFHEMPPKYIRRALAEFHRLLRPGGQLLVSEPSSKQLQPIKLLSLLKRSGWRHCYFKLLANFVHEPFLPAWHQLDKQSLFSKAGFGVREHIDKIPINFYVLDKD